MNIIVILIVEIMSRLKLDHHGKPESTERPFRFIVGLLSSAHPRSCVRDLNLGPSGLASDCLTYKPLTRPVFNGVNV